ncbi:MAG: hypothetical protein A2284_01740 [Deltaproteobacteria bacterium RIFOXYA12_FULL_61_11]|nr:MAG: hypothetical protein A2284_01740 [Deltaproteobacteria bacterium RIFOXYA12_FULL_61_11]
MTTDEPTPEHSDRPKLIEVRAVRKERGIETTTCLRPLGLCELGGSCDVCWYNPEHPRHRAKVAIVPEDSTHPDKPIT